MPMEFMETLNEGDRFELIRDVDRFPNFYAKAGLRGTIKMIDRTTNQETIWLQMDAELNGASEWDNSIEWAIMGETLADFLLDTKRVLPKRGVSTNPQTGGKVQP